MDLFHSLSFWIVRKWYGILVAQAILFLAVFLALWQFLEPMGVPDTLSRPDCGFPFNKRIFWHLFLTLAVAPILTSILDAVVRRRLWNSPELMLKLEVEFAAKLGNTEQNVFDAMRLPGTFQILEAFYWSRNSRIDVSKALRDKVVEGKLTVKADNSLGGDPEAGASKSLSVRYLDGDRIKVKTARENETISLP